MRTVVTFTGHPVSFKKVVDLELDDLPHAGEPIRVSNPETGAIHNGYVQTVAIYGDEWAEIEVQEA